MPSSSNTLSSSLSKTNLVEEYKKLRTLNFDIFELYIAQKLTLQAIKQGEKVLHCLEHVPDWELHFTVLQKMADLYDSTSQYSKSLHCLERCAQVERKSTG